MAKSKQKEVPSNQLNEDRYADIVANYDPLDNRGYGYFAKKYNVTAQRIKQIVLKAKERGDIS